MQIFISLAVMAVVSGTPPLDSVPASFRSINPYRTTPLWISRSAAVTPEGMLVEGVLEGHEANQLRTSAARLAPHATAASHSSAPVSSECDVTFGHLFDDVPADDGPSLAWTDVLRKA